MERRFHSGFVSIAGRPNAGKSTLLNRLVGEKIAITAAQPQTTRTTIQGVLTTADAQVVFIDTPGIHNSDTLINQRMMQMVREALSQRDLVLYVADASRMPTEEDQQAVSALPRQTPVLLALNKIDRVKDKRALLPVIEQYGQLFAFREIIPVSARTGGNIDSLQSAIIAALPEGERLYPNDYVTDQPLRFMGGEIVREQILRNTHAEVPHAVAILVDEWQEKRDLTRISATIYVERPGQKAIVVGAKGANLKKIGTAARQQLEKLLNKKVFLSLFVKVKPDWREDSSFLASIDWRAMVGSDQ